MEIERWCGAGADDTRHAAGAPKHPARAGGLWPPVGEHRPGGRVGSGGRVPRCSRSRDVTAHDQDRNGRGEQQRAHRAETMFRRSPSATRMRPLDCTAPASRLRPGPLAGDPSARGCVITVSAHRGPELPPPPARAGLGSVRNMLRDRWWTELGIRRLAARSGADLIHHPLPARFSVTRVTQVVRVLDLAFERLPECFDRGFRTYAHPAYRTSALAAAVICISETPPRTCCRFRRRGRWSRRLDPGRELPHPT